MRYALIEFFWALLFLALGRWCRKRWVAMIALIPAAMGVYIILYELVARR